MPEPTNMRIEPTDALILVDMQNDFMPGGALAVSHGDQTVAPLNRLTAAFERRALPVVATRDWHPRKHCSFQAQGGPWPSHCVAETAGAAFHPSLEISDRTRVISKATAVDRDAYSGFDGTGLAALLRTQGVKRLLVGGLATDYCVLHTVLDGCAAGFAVVVLEDAIRAVDVNPGDGQRAIEQMAAAGARLAASSSFLRASDPR